VTFAGSVKYLFSLGNEVSAMKLGLANIRKLLSALGNPENKYLKVQVAGTNGKGSVCAFLDAMCVSAGIKTGVFTSPHLVSVTERIRINRRDISEEDFALHATVVRETSERLLAGGELEYLPTFFEQVTAIGLLAFAAAGVKLAILETGLGGRLDATTAANAEIAAITQIDYDHHEYLGETLAEIASEKAAIIGPGSTVFIGQQGPEAERVLSERCQFFGITPRWTSEVASDGGRDRRDFETSVKRYRVWRVGLNGRHQVENAKLGILVAEHLSDRFPIRPDNIRFGLEEATHPGRLEIKGRYLFDGAHNIAGARSLRHFLDESVPQPLTMIFGAMKGKDVGGIAETIFPMAKTLILTQPANSRSMTAGEIIDAVPASLDATNILSTGSVREALEKANEVTGEDGVILVTGSLYLVGEAKRVLTDLG
jgi:dihydrofolate synthase/folylpolyglutamate synthase